MLLFHENSNFYTSMVFPSTDTFLVTLYKSLRKPHRQTTNNSPHLKDVRYN